MLGLGYIYGFDLVESYLACFYESSVPFLSENPNEKLSTTAPPWPYTSWSREFLSLERTHLGAFWLIR